MRIPPGESQRFRNLGSAGEQGGHRVFLGRGGYSIFFFASYSLIRCGEYVRNTYVVVVPEFYGKSGDPIIYKSHSPDPYKKMIRYRSVYHGDGEGAFTEICPTGLCLCILVYDLRWNSIHGSW